MDVGEATKLRRIEYGSTSSIGLFFSKAHGDNTQMSNPFGFLSYSNGVDAQMSDSFLWHFLVSTIPILFYYLLAKHIVSKLSIGT